MAAYSYKSQLIAEPDDGWINEKKKKMTTIDSEAIENRRIQRGRDRNLTKTGDSCETALARRRGRRGEDGWMMKNRQEVGRRMAFCCDQFFSYCSEKGTPGG